MTRALPCQGRILCTVPEVHTPPTKPRRQTRTLSAKQARLVELMTSPIAPASKAEAARVAGYLERNFSQGGREALRSPYVQAAIRAKLEKRTDKARAIHEKSGDVVLNGVSGDDVDPLLALATWKESHNIIKDSPDEPEPQESVEIAGMKVALQVMRGIVAGARNPTCLARAVATQSRLEGKLGIERPQGVVVRVVNVDQEPMR